MTHDRNARGPRDQLRTNICEHDEVTYRSKKWRTTRAARRGFPPDRPDVAAIAKHLGKEA